MISAPLLMLVGGLFLSPVSFSTAAIAPHLNVTIRTDNKDDFEAGTPRVLACIVVGCAPSLNVTWYLGDIVLRPNVYKEVNRGNFTVSSLTFVPSLTDNDKDLVCRATNGHLSQVFEDRVTISVGQRPKCVDSTYTTVSAVEGEPQSLSCFVESQPDPEQFVWSFPGGRTIYTSNEDYDTPDLNPAHPEDAPPIVVTYTKSRYHPLTVIGVFSITTAVAYCAVKIIRKCLCGRRQGQNPQMNENLEINENLEMNEIGERDMDVGNFLEEDDTPRIPPSTGSCKDYGIPFHKHEYCV